MSKIIALEIESLPENCYVFKNSTTCPVSHAAATEVKAATPSLPIYWINVIEQRPLSNWFAAQYAVKHESPQLILIKDGSVAQTWSHGGVKRGVLE
jgi:bacillithiol system protein YtxJ